MTRIHTYIHALIACGAPRAYGLAGQFKLPPNQRASDVNEHKSLREKQREKERERENEREREKMEESER